MAKSSLITKSIEENGHDAEWNHGVSQNYHEVSLKIEPSVVSLYEQYKLYKLVDLLILLDLINPKDLTLLNRILEYSCFSIQEL